MLLGLFTSRRDSAVAAQVDEILASAPPGSVVLVILQVYQTGRNGSKAYVQLEGTDWTRDAYFWWTPVLPGAIVIVSEISWSEPVARDDALRIGGKDHPPGTGVVATIPPYQVKRWTRHHRRQ